MFYIIYKYFKDQAKPNEETIEGKKASFWADLESISINGCRYVTDFGLELLYRAMSPSSRKNLQLDRNKCLGCKKLLYFTMNGVDLSDFTYCDVLSLSSLSHANDQTTNVRSSPSSTQLYTFKLIILNDTKLDLVNYLLNKEVTLEKRLIIHYAKLKFKNKQPNQPDYTFNVFEFDSVLFYFFINIFLLNQ